MIGVRMLLLVSLMVVAGCAKPEVELPPVAVWESAPDAARHVPLTLYQKKSVIEYVSIRIQVVTVIRGDALFWISDPDDAGRPQPGTQEVQFAAIEKNRDLLVRFVPGMTDDSGLPPYRLHKKPNQSLEPTPTAGTSAAEPPRVPAAVVAHL